MDPLISSDDAAGPRQPARALLGGLGMAVVSAALGYLCGRVRGEGNEVLLAVCFGAAGALVGLLGYGWVVGIFVGVARILGCNRQRGKTTSADAVTRPENEPEDW